MCPLEINDRVWMHLHEILTKILGKKQTTTKNCIYSMVKFWSKQAYK